MKKHETLLLMNEVNGEIRGFRLRTVVLVGVIAAVLGFVVGLIVRG